MLLDMLDKLCGRIEEFREKKEQLDMRIVYQCFITDVITLVSQLHEAFLILHLAVTSPCLAPYITFLRIESHLTNTDTYSTHSIVPGTILILQTFHPFG